jgi:hypothetical protein
MPSRLLGEFRIDVDAPVLEYLRAEQRTPLLPAVVVGYGCFDSERVRFAISFYAQHDRSASDAHDPWPWQCNTPKYALQGPTSSLY